MPCTVIVENDLADRLLNRDLNPQWNGELTRLVDAFPTNEELWETYFKLREDDLRRGDGRNTAREFYRSRRPEMDAGASVPWPERFDGERFDSALEEAMVRRRDDPEAFAAEYQNCPVRSESVRGEQRELHAADLVGRVNSLPRGVVPRECSRLTAFIDVGGSVLWWAVVGWSERFSGGVVDYGSWPRQTRSYYTSADAAPNLATVFPAATEEQRVYAGLKALTGEILGQHFPRDGGNSPLVVAKCLIDCGWLPAVVHQMIRESPHKAVLVPSKGYSTASSIRAMDDWPSKDDEQVGSSWRLGPSPTRRGQQLIFDPDHWKGFLADRLTTAPGGGGCLQFFGDATQQHKLLADHLCAEYAVRVTTRNRTFDQWEKKPGGRENHLLDVLTGCAVAASVNGLVWSPGSSGEPPVPKPPRPKIKMSDLYYAKHGVRY